MTDSEGWPNPPKTPLPGEAGYVPPPKQGCAVPFFFIILPGLSAAIGIAVWVTT